MQFITTDQRIAIENFEVGVVYTVAFTSGDSFTGACIGIGPDFVAFQRTAPKLLFCLTMTTAADIAGIDPLGDDICKIIEYTGTVPTTIKTDGTPLIDYLITGKTVQNGTPTPENPIMPQGTGEMTGNLFDGSVSETSRYLTSDGQTASSSAFNISDYIPCDAETTYTIENVNGDSVFPSVCFYSPQKDFLGGVNYNRASGITFDTPVDCTYLKVSYKKIMAAQAMLNTGSTALPYEPYGYKIPISSANTTTPVYLGEVETTRRVKKLVLDGTETITEESTNVYSTPINDTVTAGAGLSTHFEYDSTVLTGQFRIEAGKAIFGYNDTLANFSTFLAAQYAAGTPVTVWYVLANEETAVINEPLMRIGDYADTLSKAQAGVQIPTTDGLNIFNIDTTVKPSEVYLKYFSPIFRK